MGGGVDGGVGGQEDEGKIAGFLRRLTAGSGLKAGGASPLRAAKSQPMSQYSTWGGVGWRGVCEACRGRVGDQGGGDGDRREGHGVTAKAKFRARGMPGHGHEWGTSSDRGWVVGRRRAVLTIIAARAYDRRAVASGAAAVWVERRGDMGKARLGGNELGGRH